MIHTCQTAVLSNQKIILSKVDKRHQKNFSKEFKMPSEKIQQLKEGTRHGEKRGMGWR